MGVYISLIDELYTLEAIFEGWTPSGSPSPNLGSQGTRFHISTSVLDVFAWTGIFAVKYSFLSFFKMLISRVFRAMNILWWTVTIVTTIAWMAGFAALFSCRCSYWNNDTCTNKILVKFAALLKPSYSRVYSSSIGQYYPKCCNGCIRCRYRLCQYALNRVNRILSIN